MTETEQAAALGADIDRLINRYRREFDLCYASAMGVLFYKAHILATQCLQNPYDQDDDDQDEFDKPNPEP
jgi:hypothetical protein